MATDKARMDGRLTISAQCLKEEETTSAISNRSTGRAMSRRATDEPNAEKRVDWVNTLLITKTAAAPAHELLYSHV